MFCFYSYFLIIFFDIISYCSGCFPTQQSDTGPNVPIGSMTGNTLPNDPTCLCGTFPTSGGLVATPPIVIINPFTCLITVTLQCLPLGLPPAQRLEFNGGTFTVPTPPPYTITCGGTGQYTYVDAFLNQVVVTSATCIV